MNFKRVRVVIAGVLVLSLLCFGGTMVYANGQGMGATVTKDFGCGAWYYLDEEQVFLSTDDMSMAVGTPSGNMMLSCHFDVPEGKEPAKAMKLTPEDLPGVMCGIPGDPGMVTDDWMLVVTPGGKATLTCKINPRSK